MLAVTDQPRSTTAWDVGAIGEERLGQGLDRIGCDTVRVLHDRRIPRSRANIDHLAVTAGGVYVKIAAAMVVAMVAAAVDLASDRVVFALAFI
jgi:hypothetical protein